MGKYEFYPGVDNEGGELNGALRGLASELDSLAAAARELVRGFENLGTPMERAGGEGGAAIGDLSRIGGQIIDSIRGTGSALFYGGFDDAGRKFLRNFAGKIGGDVSDALSEALGGSFLADLFGGIAGELVRGLGGFFEKKKKYLSPAELPEVFSPPALLALPASLLPSSAALGARFPSANVNVTVTGVIGTPRDVADEVSRIVTRTLGDLTRRAA